MPRVAAAVAAGGVVALRHGNAVADTNALAHRDALAVFTEHVPSAELS